MKRTALALSLSALVLLGCACPPRLPQTFEQRSNPKVTVENGRVAVSPDPLYFVPGEKGTITWHLPEGSKFRFPPNGIDIVGKLIQPPQRDAGPNAPRDVKRNDLSIGDSDGEITCAREAGDKGLTFKCENRHTKPGLYKYIIRVQDGSGTIELDPFIMNM